MTVVCGDPRVAILSGATASVVAFAIAAVMIPHAAATAFRCWRLRTYIDTDVLLRFGSFSAIGALFGDGRSYVQP